MTRHRLNRNLRRTFILLGLVLIVAFVAKFAPYAPRVRGTLFEALANDAYGFLKDMAPVFLTIAAAYLASVFQRRATFVSGLERQWREIVEAKMLVLTFLEKPYPSTDDWLAAQARLSATIDTMRIVYRNAGETRDLVGLYPYAPLHDMRRVLEAADPRARNSIPTAERQMAREAVTQSFYALREHFLDELDLEQPGQPVLISGARRLKSPGAAPFASAQQKRQREAMVKSASPMPEIDAYLAALYIKERSKEGVPTDPSGNGWPVTGGGSAAAAANGTAAGARSQSIPPSENGAGGGKRV